MKPLLAVAQMTSNEDLEENFRTVSKLAQQAQIRGVSLLCFPEDFAFLPNNMAKRGSISESIEGPLFSKYRALATEFKMTMSFGGFQEKDDRGRLYNTHIIVAPDGQIAASYRKIHLFGAALNDGTCIDESEHCEAGEELCTVQTELGMLGLSVCYDLRFSELYRSLAEAGSEILLVPSAFTVQTGKAHWEVLLRARAIENQCYVAAAAQFGQNHENRATHGHAMIVDPWGTVIAQCSDSESLAIAEIDPNYLKQVRSQIPMAKHRRPELFH